MKKHIGAAPFPREPPVGHSLQPPVPRSILLLLGSTGQEGEGPSESRRGVRTAWGLQGEATAGPQDGPDPFSPLLGLQVQPP